MRTARKLRAAGEGTFLLETLEERQLLAWGAFPVLIGQDQAASDFAQYNGAGQVIADLDTGINFRHPALAGRIWTNPGEIPGNGIDDDRDGKVDDVNGWDFVADDNNPADDQGHGTMTAGIIAANPFINTGNTHGYSGDGMQYAGIASGAQVIPLKVIDASQTLDVTRVQAALQWVIDNHARYNITAVNMSMDVGSDGYGTIADEVQTLWDSGVFIAASSGNGANLSNWLSWPAASAYAAAVGGMNVDGSVTWLTTRGPSLDVLAPGNGVPYLSQGTDYYLGGAGTSYATPFVAGAAAVIKQVNPAFTPNDILQILRDSGTDVYDSGTRLFFKRLNIENAIKLALARTRNRQAAPSPLPPQTVFGGAPIPVPGYIQAESFDDGGEGVAYWDASAKNLGGAMRATSVDLFAARDTGDGYRVGDVRPGEWLEYTVNMANPGIYNLSVRVASPDGGGVFHVEQDGVDKTGPITVPATGGWNSWMTIAKTGVALDAGQHVLRLEMDAAAPTGLVGDFNWLNLTYISPPPTSAPVALQSATNTIQAESCSAYSGLVKGSGGLAYVDQGDWAQYKGIDFGTGVNAFTINIALADAYAGKQIILRTDSPTGPIIGALTTQGTGGWGIYKQQTASIAGTVGIHDLYLTFAGGYGVGNIESFRFTPAPIAQTANYSARSLIQAENFTAQSGVVKGTSGISYVDAGDWLQYKAVDFAAGVSSFSIAMAVADAYAGKQIVLRADSLTGPVIGSLTTAGTGGWGIYKVETAAISGITGIHDLYLTFQGGDGIGNIDCFTFG